MVAKISSGKNIIGALKYNSEKLEAQQATVFLSNKMVNIINGESTVSIANVMKGFEVCLANNLRTQNPVIHISLNPDPKDKLTDGQLSGIVRDYMEAMGYGSQPYICYKHKDIDREHLHVVSVRVDETGRKINDSFENRRSMDVCSELEQKYGLHPATKKVREDAAQLKKIDYKRGDIKHQLSNTVKSLAATYKFQSVSEFHTLLECYNVTLNEVRGTVRGEEYNGLVYSVTDGRGNPVGVPFKSSRLGKSVGYDGLQKRIEMSATAIKESGLKEQVKEKVSGAMQQARSRADYEKELKKNGVEVILRKNDAGRIYGASFIDHQTKCVFNGSRLGKEFSANVFNELFNSPQKVVPKHQTQDPAHAPEPQLENSQESGDSALDIFTMEPNGVNIEEEAFIRRMRKKKRPRRI